MVVNGDVVILNKKDVERIIDAECQKRLHMSGKEFSWKYNNGELPDSTAIHDIEMLLKLA
ncbi:MAG: hypothetical protein QF704_14655 [Anaerolineales bacterium]|nr:hypothetical protein [Anaerolineales bacterium]